MEHMNLPTYITGTIQTRAYVILRENVFYVLNSHNVTTTQWSMLGITLEAKDGIRQADVAKKMNVKPPLITVLVRQLEERKLLQTAPNQFDARAKLLSVTSDGKKFIKTTELELHKVIDKLLIGLTEKDLITYHKVLNTIIANDLTNKKHQNSISKTKINK
jgi:DNA-binding MarR family transcriptional regulator